MATTTPRLTRTRPRQGRPLPATLHAAILAALTGVVFTALPVEAQRTPGQRLEDAQTMRGPGMGSRLQPEADEDSTRPAVADLAPRSFSLLWPRIASDIPSRERRTLVRAYTRAVERVRAHQGCQQLFGKFSVDGAELLARTYYLRARPNDQGICASGAVAFTRVHDPRCWICGRFGSLSVDAGAMILIHEALHLAGMPEDPAGEEALSPSGINNLVRHACLLN